MPSDEENAGADSPEALSQPDGNDYPTEEARKLRWGWRVAIATVVVLAAAFLITSQWMVPYYAITPGHAFSIGTLITVPRGDGHVHKGAIVLTDVDLSHLSALGYVYYELHDSSEVVSSSDLTGGQSSSEYDEEGVIDMWDARQAATLVALRTLGYPAKAIAAGAVVYAVEPGTTAAAAPGVGSVIVGVDGTQALTIAALRRVLADHRPGSVVSLAFHVIGGSKASSHSYRVGELARSSKATGSVLECEQFGARIANPVLADGKLEGCVPNIYVVQTFRDVGLPFKVQLSSGGIIGPSAGLSFTLGLIEKLDRADLTGGKLVAATGTMSNNGSVGAVGGVAEKTRAVRAAGAQVFLVPPSGLQAARANAGSHLKVIAVATIGQAVSALERLGGRLEPARARD